MANKPAVALAICLLSPPALSRDLAGWLESARLEPEGLRLPAKLDTGADTTSLGATDIRLFSVDGSDHVAFRPQIAAAREVWIERPLTRFAQIKTHGGQPERRPVICLRLCLVSVLKEVEVTLADRSQYDYPLLIGRNFLAGDIIADPAKVFTAEPSCVAEPGNQNQRSEE